MPACNTFNNKGELELEYLTESKSLSVISIQVNPFLPLYVAVLSRFVLEHTVAGVPLDDVTTPLIRVLVPLYRTALFLVAFPACGRRGRRLGSTMGCFSLKARVSCTSTSFYCLFLLLPRDSERDRLYVFWAKVEDIIMFVNIITLVKVHFFTMSGSDITRLSD